MRVGGASAHGAYVAHSCSYPRTRATPVRALHRATGPRSTATSVHRRRPQIDYAEADGTRAPMLILTRRLGESLRIGDQITVTVLGIKGNQIRIGIDAPKHVAVHREEIAARIAAQRDDDEAAPPTDDE